MTRIKKLIISLALHHRMPVRGEYARICNIAAVPFQRTRCITDKLFQLAWTNMFRLRKLRMLQRISFLFQRQLLSCQSYIHCYMLCYFFPDTSSFYHCLRQCRIKLKQLDMQKGGAGGVCALSGRKPDPIWHDFETIRTPENLAKPAPNRLFKCKFCAQTVSARVERLKKHKKECLKSFQVIVSYVYDFNLFLKVNALTV